MRESKSERMVDIKLTRSSSSCKLTLSSSCANLTPSSSFDDFHRFQSKDVVSSSLMKCFQTKMRLTAAGLIISEVSNDSEKRFNSSNKSLSKSSHSERTSNQPLNQRSECEISSDSRTPCDSYVNDNPCCTTDSASPCNVYEIFSRASSASTFCTSENTESESESEFDTDESPNTAFCTVSEVSTLDHMQANNKNSHRHNHDITPTEIKKNSKMTMRRRPSGDTVRSGTSHTSSDDLSQRNGLSHGTSPGKINALSHMPLSIRHLRVKPSVGTRLKVTPSNTPWEFTKNKIVRPIRRLRTRVRKPRPPLRFVIPSDHPIKICWDICTVLLSIMSAYLTHTSIRERNYDRGGPLIRFCEIWFLIDIMLNFVTQHRSGKHIQSSHRSIWARYLTSWFVIDVISFLPWEKVWVKPVVEMQKRRNIFHKTFRRSKTVFKVTRVLRGRHLKLFGRVANHTKHAGVGSRRLLQMLIRYTPKYFVFCKNMKAVLAVRMLRQVHWWRKVIKSLGRKEQDEETVEEEVEDADENDNIQVEYEILETRDDTTEISDEFEPMLVSEFNPKTSFPIVSYEDD